MDGAAGGGGEGGPGQSDPRGETGSDWILGAGRVRVGGDSFAGTKTKTTGGGNEGVGAGFQGDDDDRGRRGEFLERDEDEDEDEETRLGKRLVASVVAYLGQVGGTATSETLATRFREEAAGQAVLFKQCLKQVARMTRDRATGEKVWALRDEFRAAAAAATTTTTNAGRGGGG